MFIVYFCVYVFLMNKDVYNIITETKIQKYEKKLVLKYGHNEASERRRHNVQMYASAIIEFTRFTHMTLNFDL